MQITKVGRNDACPCGSGKKFKHCCAAKLGTGTLTAPGRVMLAVLIGALVAAVFFVVGSFTGDRSSVGPRQIWSAEHGHYHNAP